MITDPTLERQPGIRHAFFTRQGGVSGGIYDSLNCGLGSRDDPDHVAENRRRAAERFDVGPDNLLSLYQYHSTEVITVEQPWRREDQPKADALVTRQPGIALGVLTADCAPVLLADGKAGVVGAAHAGWRGALAGVVDATVEAMEKLGADRTGMFAVVGPTIGPKSYEVGPEFPRPFIDQDPSHEDLFAPAGREGHWMFDLPEYLHRRMIKLGIARIAIRVEDTVADPDRFFSYRRACHRGETDYGRGLSAIMLAA